MLTLNLRARIPALSVEKRLKEEGIIFDIQRFSVHDGPGIRTLVFLKGCSLRCQWCANPESQRFVPEILFDPGRCIGCGRCVEVCQNNAVQRVNGRIHYLREHCIDCGSCAETCYAEARIVKGRLYRVDEAVQEILKDEPFYAESGGGVTLSGGEPLDQPDFSETLLRACKEKGLHTAVETAGNVSWKNILQVMPFTDLFLYDIKHMDAEKLRTFTRADAARIGSNLKALSRQGTTIIVRTPVIPGFNDTPEEIGEIARFVQTLNLSEVHLLPYHRYGQGKYRLLGRVYPFAGPEAVSEEKIAVLKETAQKEGLSVQIGG